MSQEALMKVITDNEWPHTPMDENTVRLDVVGDNGNWTAYVRTSAEPDQILVYAVCNSKTPEEKRQAMAELVTRANYGLKIGNFELDFGDGEVRYKTSLHFVGQIEQEPMINQLVLTNILTMDHYMPALMALIYTDLSPVEALGKVEG
jgi:hypothetical protein